MLWKEYKLFWMDSKNIVEIFLNVFGGSSKCSGRVLKNSRTIIKRSGRILKYSTRILKRTRRILKGSRKIL